MIQQALNQAAGAVSCSPNHCIALPSKCHGRKNELLLTVEKEQNEENPEWPGTIWEAFLWAVEFSA